MQKTTKLDNQALESEIKASDGSKFVDDEVGCVTSQNSS